MHKNVLKLRFEKAENILKKNQNFKNKVDQSEFSNIGKEEHNIYSVLFPMIMLEKRAFKDIIMF